MQPHDRVRVQHMVDAIESAQRFVAGRQRQDLDKDEMLLFALVRAIEIIGEATTKLSVDVRANNADIPWDAISGMRHRLVHAYFDVDADIVWSTVTRALPALLAQLQALLR